MSKFWIFFSTSTSLCDWQTHPKKETLVKTSLLYDKTYWWWWTKTQNLAVLDIHITNLWSHSFLLRSLRSMVPRAVTNKSMAFVPTSQPDWFQLKITLFDSYIIGYFYSSRCILGMGIPQHYVIYDKSPILTTKQHPCLKPTKPT